MIRPRITGQVQPDLPVTVLLYGLSGTGKTMLAATLPAPVAIIDAEKGEGVRTLDAAGLEITAIPVATYQDALDATTWLRSNAGHFRSVVLDGLSTLEDSLYADLVSRGGSVVQKNAPEVIAQAGWGVLGAQHLRIREAFLRLPIQHKLLIAHSHTVDGVEVPLVSGAQGKKAPVYATMVLHLRCRKVNGVLTRYVQTLHDGSTLSKNRLGCLAATEPADFRSIFHKLGLAVLPTPADAPRADARQPVAFPWQGVTETEPEPDADTDTDTEPEAGQQTEE